MSKTNLQERRDVTRRPPEDFVTLLLKPFLVVAFALVHLLYHLTLLCIDLSRSAQSIGTRNTASQIAQFRSLEDILDCTDIDGDQIRVPKHLTLVLADTPPSSFRLGVSVLSQRLRGTDSEDKKHRDVWSELRNLRKLAIEVKNAKDAATIIHLSRISNVEQLTIYSQQSLLPVIGLMKESLSELYNTKVAIIGAGNTNNRKSNDNKYRSVWPSQKSETTSSSSSDTEGSSSIDETLASSYTAEWESSSEDASDAVVDIIIGSDPKSPVEDRGQPGHQEANPAAKRLRVVLLDASNSDELFAQILSQVACKRGQQYLDTITKDLDVARSGTERFSASTLRQSWVAKRDTIVSALTVPVLDKHLMEAGYISEPDLVVVYGGRTRSRQLHGFPSWALRLSDLFFDPMMKPGLAYSSRDFVAALRKFSTSEQRYGR